MFSGSPNFTHQMKLCHMPMSLGQIDFTHATNQGLTQAFFPYCTLSTYRSC